MHGLVILIVLLYGLHVMLPVVFPRLAVHAVAATIGNGLFH